MLRRNAIIVNNKHDFLFPHSHTELKTRFRQWPKIKSVVLRQEIKAEKTIMIGWFVVWCAVDWIHFSWAYCESELHCHCSSLSVRRCLSSLPSISIQLLSLSLLLLLFVIYYCIAVHRACNTNDKCVSLRSFRMPVCVCRAHEKSVIRFGNGHSFGSNSSGNFSHFAQSKSLVSFVFRQIAKK